MTNQTKANGSNSDLLKRIDNLLKGYTVSVPKPIFGAETIQILLVREILDYTVLRTEETRELNTVVVPTSVTDSKDMTRVAFLATKQKAAESRELERMLRTALGANVANLKASETTLDKDKKKNIEEFEKLAAIECYLKDKLCLQCPRCALYGGTKTSEGEKLANIKHRIEYSTAFSLLSFGDIESSTTFNAIDDNTLKTGQALGSRYAVLPAKIFPSVVTLRSVTKEEFVLAIKTLLATKSYGAESRIGGDIRNHIVGIVLGWEEVITALEFTLELFDAKQKDKEINGSTVEPILTQYKAMAGNQGKVKVVGNTEIESLVSAASAIEFDSDYLKKIYEDVQEYRKLQTS